MSSKFFVVSLILVVALVSAGAVYAYTQKQMTDVGGVLLENEWLTCQQDSDCALVAAGCGNYTPANTSSVKQVTEKAYKRFGDPRVLDCEMAPNAPKYNHIAKCIVQVCTYEPELIEEKQ